jgi:three-Cys-motif partner protein
MVGSGAPMVSDSDPKKWGYKDHTRVKHELLDKYLGGWLAILGNLHRKLLIVDGFAGRGEYVDWPGGSPTIIMNKAQELITAGRLSSAVCLLVEENAENFDNLKEVLNKKSHDYPDVQVLGPFNETFEDVARQAIEQTNGNLIPSFWFIDPFGFTGMSFDTVSQIMSLNRSEVFITLMLRDMGRFLGHAALDKTFNRLFGTSAWRAIVYSNMTGVAKEQELRDLYIDQLRVIGCKVTLFRVCMDEKLQTLYYMVHATKHAKGRWLMKGVMRRQGVNGVFAFLGPQDKILKAQASLFPNEDIPALKSQLLAKYPGRTISFDQLLSKCCDDNELTESDYRTALQQLRQEGKIEVNPVTSKTDKGLQGHDSITFPKD